MASEQHGFDLVRVVALLGAGMVAVPLFKRLRLGSVLGYLAAGLLVGQSGFGIVTDAQAILHVAELGVVLFLFVVGLEMRPSHLWHMRGEIFGLGTAQVVVAGALLTCVGWLLALPFWAAFFTAMGFVLSSTAIVMQLMNERGDTATGQGQRAISTLLLEDLAIVPLLVVIPLVSPHAHAAGSSRWLGFALGLAALGGLVLGGRYLLNPLFRLLAEARVREVMTGAALFVVLGSALLMQAGGLSMAMGAFIAGVLLSESSFRHQLEADVEPFRGLLLGLFFLAVGMSLNLSAVASDWRVIVLSVVVFCAIKLLATYAVARLFRLGHREALYRGVMFVQGGEFAFVLYGSAADAGLFDPRTQLVTTATVIISMALTPLGVMLLPWILPPESKSMEGVEAPDGLSGTVLVVGFGRFGQVASQFLLARGIDVAIIDRDTEMIQSAAKFGFKIYYGDGSRLDVLRASGLERARALALCIDDRAATNHIVEVVRAEFPAIKILVRAYDRAHAIDLSAKNVDYFIRETFESAMVFGRQTLLELGLSEEEADATAGDLRRRDLERLALQTLGGLSAGKDLLHDNAAPAAPRPEPLVAPRRAAQALNEGAAHVAPGLDRASALPPEPRAQD